MICNEKFCKNFKNNTDDDPSTSVCICDHVTYNQAKKLNTCENIEPVHSCINCTFSIAKDYSDTIDYKCTLENNRIIYSEENPLKPNYSNYPECELDLFEAQ